MDDEYLKIIRNEATRHSEVSNHPCVVRLLGFCDEMRGIVIEYCPYGSMEDVLIKRRLFESKDDRLIVLKVCFYCLFVHFNLFNIIEIYHLHYFLFDHSFKINEM